MENRHVVVDDDDDDVILFPRVFDGALTPRWGNPLNELGFVLVWVIPAAETALLLHHRSIRHIGVCVSSTRLDENSLQIES